MLQLGTVRSTGSEEQIGSIAGDASYLIDEYNVPTRIRNTYYSTETGKSIGNDYYQQSQYILGVFDMKGKDFRQDLNEAAQAYNDTATADKGHAWTGDNYTLPHFRTADVFFYRNGLLHRASGANHPESGQRSKQHGIEIQENHRNGLHGNSIERHGNRH